MSVALLFRRTPVRNVPLPRAWSPAPSRPGLGVQVVQAAEDLDRSLSGSSGSSVRLELEVGPLAARPPGGRDGAVGEVDERRPQRRARGGRRPGRRPPAAASSRDAPSDSNAGSAMQAPSPRRKWRRLRPSGRRRVGRRSSLAVMVGSSSGRVRTPGRRPVRRSAVSAASDRRRFWNGADSMMPGAGRRRGRPPPRAARRSRRRPATS